MLLRSASDFPPSPAPVALEGTDQECRAALVSANRSRGALKAESDRRGLVIAELKRELAELETDLADKARNLLDSLDQGFPVAYWLAWRNPTDLFLVKHRRLMANKIRQWLDIL
jgi:hypothetical protein